MRRLLVLIAALLIGCGDADVGTTPDATEDITVPVEVIPLLTKEELMDPETCKECHQAHYDEWSGSMHAYASLDPVFLAMNARGQRETGGELGDFCVQCHAPMAVKLGLITDGLNLQDIPAYAQGITCYFCHTVEAVEGVHNNPLVLADDMVMRGAYSDPVPNTGHASAYSPLLDRERIESAALCGSCHDIVTPKGVHLERTYAEWQASLFSHEVPDEQQTCGNCHMSGRDDTAAEYEGVFLRRVHDHAPRSVALHAQHLLAECPASARRLVPRRRAVGVLGGAGLHPHPSAICCLKSSVPPNCLWSVVASSAMPLWRLS